ncbi:Uu.00g024030.m01.CDS01 [Anthostomella pinea]|uniref:Uu.00g024030.m01.CDS01 n=1 Tax=Anthostomella pinea TaxID=933095 RepID=A0AAI8YQZ5_9PEZI|nr:Uu.00g024030.m01.CDS01 [Anthostomella pinea]
MIKRYSNALLGAGNEIPGERFREKRQKQYEHLLFPALIIGNDNVDTFRRVTKWLAYNGTGHLMERNALVAREGEAPSYVNRMRMPKAVIRQVRVARSFLRNRLCDEIYKHLSDFTKSMCPCRISGQWNFIQALEATGIYPFENVEAYSLAWMLEKLKTFEYFAPEGAKDCVCGPWVSGATKHLAGEIAGLFQGLCLDCMWHSSQTELHPDYISRYLRYQGGDVMSRHLAAKGRNSCQDIWATRVDGTSATSLVVARGMATGAGVIRGFTRSIRGRIFFDVTKRLTLTTTRSSAITDARECTESGQWWLAGHTNTPT